jgi:O-antigen/teichoic acid export membrane protein
MSVLSNVSISLAGKVVAVVLVLGSTMILARLLTPEELGVYAIVAGLSALLAAFKNFGTSNYLIQNTELTKRSVASALTVTALISWSVGALLAVSSEALALFFEQPDMRSIANVLAINFLFAPWLAIGTAILIRLHRFRDLVLIETASGIVHAAVGIGLVLAGLGPLALALGVVAHSLTGFFAFVLLRLPAFTLLPGFSELGGVLRFGAWSSGITLANQLSARGNEVVIGKQLGVDATAIFDKGLAVPRLIADLALGEILRVLLPVFADRRRSGVGSKDSYLYYFGILATVLGPAYAFLAVHADLIVRILLGDQWGAAVPIATLGALELMIASPFLLGEKVMIAEGCVRRLFVVKLWQMCLRIFILAALVNLGLVLLSAGFVFASAAYAVLMHRETARIMHISARDLLNALLAPLLLVVITLAAAVANRVFLPLSGQSEISTLVGGAGVCIAGWSIAVVVLRLPIYRILRDRVAGKLLTIAWQRMLCRTRRHF